MSRLLEVAKTILKMATPNPVRGHMPSSMDDHIVAGSLMKELRQAVEEETEPEQKMGKLEVLLDRWKESEKWSTGIFVRARTPDGVTAADIAVLTPDSLLRWLRSAGERNHIAENTVGILLGHGHISSQLIGKEK